MSPTVSRIAFLGLGAMGSRMATRLLQAGHAVTVWNRSPAPIPALQAAGAQVAATPRQAAQDADFVIAMVRDDEAARRVWCDTETGALAGMRADAVAIESSTLSVAAVRQLHGAAQAVGVALLDAPVSGSRPAAQAGQLVFLVGGEATAFTRAEPVLLAMGVAARHVGPVGQGALAKLVTNTLLGVHVAALAELIGLVRQQGAEPADLLRAVSATSVWAPVDHYLAGSMLSGDFAPQFPVELIAKDFGYVVQAGAQAAGLPVAAAAQRVFQQAAAQRLGAQNMTAVVQLYPPVSSAR